MMIEIIYDEFGILKLETWWHLLYVHIKHYVMVSRSMMAIFTIFFTENWLKKLTTRWRQDHIWIFWIGGNLGNPSTVTQKFTFTLECFCHFSFDQSFFLTRNIRLFTSTSETEKNMSSAYSWRIRCRSILNWFFFTRFSVTRF